MGRRGLVVDGTDSVSDVNDASHAKCKMNSSSQISSPILHQNVGFC